MKTAKTNRFGSRLHKQQVKTFARCYDDICLGIGMCRMKIVAEVSWDVQNSTIKDRNTLYIKATIYRKDRHSRWMPWHDNPIVPTIVKHLPQLKPLQKWYRSTSEEPLGYFSAVYHAGDRDISGHRAGEVVAAEYYVGYHHGSHGVLESALCLFRDGKPEPAVFKTKSMATKTAKACGGCVSEHVLVRGMGKSRGFEEARQLARWPDATDKQRSVSSKRLRLRLEQRLPIVMKQFQEDVENIGLMW